MKKLEVKNGEMVNIDIYHNGTLIFSGDKYEFFEQLYPFLSRTTPQK